MKNCPGWITTFASLVRPGSLVAMVGLLVLGGFIFAAVELFAPTAGERAMHTFVGFFAAMNDSYYTTIQVMFTAYVFGRSGEAVATSIADASVKKAEVSG